MLGKRREPAESLNLSSQGPGKRFRRPDADDCVEDVAPTSPSYETPGHEREGETERALGRSSTPPQLTSGSSTGAPYDHDQLPNLGIVASKYQAQVETLNAKNNEISKKLAEAQRELQDQRKTVLEKTRALEEKTKELREKETERIEMNFIVKKAFELQALQAWAVRKINYTDEAMKSALEELRLYKDGDTPVKAAARERTRIMMEKEVRDGPQVGLYAAALEEYYQLEKYVKHQKAQRNRNVNGGASKVLAPDD